MGEQFLSNREIKLLIDKRVADAKLEVAEKRLNFLLAFGAVLLTLFGIFLPLFLTAKSTDRVDSAIERMDDKFNELAGKQLRKPEIFCSVDGRPLQNSVLVFEPSSPRETIIVKNVGDGTADFIRMRLYINYMDDDLRNSLGESNFWAGNDSDKPSYSTMLRYEKEINILPAQDSISVNLWMFTLQQRKNEVEANAMLVIYYGEPSPVEVPFTLILKNSG